MTEKYKMDPNRFQEILWRSMLNSVLFYALVFGGVLCISYFNNSNKSFELGSFLNIVPFFIAAASIGVFIAIRRQKRLFDSYNLILSNNKIIREQANAPMIEIQFEDIKSILKSRNGDFHIIGNNSSGLIHIQHQIEKYEELELRLNEIKPIEIHIQPVFIQRLLIPLVMVLTLGVMGTLIIATNKIIVGISGVVLNGFLIWSFIFIQRNKNIDKSIKRVSYWTILVLLSMISITIVKLLK